MRRTAEYLNGTVDRLRAESSIGGTVGHAGNIGDNREIFLRSFLSDHLPRRLTVSQGGTVIDGAGNESRQIDLIVAHDLGLRFESSNRTFVVAESVVSAISVKSRLDSAAVREAVNGLYSIPQADTNLINFAVPAAVSRYPKVYPLLVLFVYESDIGHPGGPFVRERVCVIANGRYLINCHLDGAVLTSGMPIPPGEFSISRLEEAHRGYCLSFMLHRIISYVGWLNYMELNAEPYMDLSNWSEG